MRTALAALVLAMLWLPAPGRADLLLRAPTLEGAEPAPAPLHLDVPSLALGGAGDLRAGSGAGPGRVEPAVALILGIFPGFGLGHYVAGSPQWTNWLIIDVVLLAAALVVSALDVGPLIALAWVAWIVEHVIQGIDAYHKAGGGRIASRALRPEAVLALAPAREAAPPGAPGEAPRVVLARF